MGRNAVVGDWRLRLRASAAVAAVLACLAGGVLGTSGCGKPNFANIGLRKQVAQLEKENARLKAERAADGAATRPVEFGGKPALDQMVTMAGMKFSRLTAIEKAGSGGGVLKLYVVPSDGRGDSFKTAGDLAVRVLGADGVTLGERRVGREELADSFYGTGVLYTYIVDVPLTGEVESSYPVKVEVEFTELLTARVFEGTHVIKSPEAGR